MEEAVQTLQKLAKTLRESYETTNTAILRKGALSIIQRIDKLKIYVKEQKNHKSNTLNIVKTRLEKIKRTLSQLALKKRGREKNKEGLYAETAIKGHKITLTQNKNKKITPETVKNNR
jgi:hypothetical protein